jgi:hypothetical protein
LTKSTSIAIHFRMNIPNPTPVTSMNVKYQKLKLKEIT